jgi:nicotinamide-nucleotide amidase
MAEGALAASPGDIALSITGFAEKDPESGQPGGLVHFALARRGGPTVHREERYGEIGRAEVRVKSLQTALEMIKAALG